MSYIEALIDDDENVLFGEHETPENYHVGDLVDIVKKKLRQEYPDARIEVGIGSGRPDYVTDLDSDFYHIHTIIQDAWEEWFNDLE